MGELRDRWDGLSAARSKTGLQTNLDADLATLISDLIDSVENGGSSGTMVLQGDFNPQNGPGFFPQASDCRIPENGIKAGFAFTAIAANIVAGVPISEGDLVIARVDNAGNQTPEDWEIQEGNIVGNASLIASATDIEIGTVGQVSINYINGKTPTSHFITHLMIKKKSGSGTDLLFKIYSTNGEIKVALDTTEFDLSNNLIAPLPAISSQDIQGSSTIYLSTETSNGSFLADVKVYGLPY